MKFTYWWIIFIAPLCLATAILFLRMGNGFVSHSGLVHIAYDQEEGYRFIRNGKPFYVRGASGDAYFEELERSGGNTIRIYKPDSLPVALERAEKLGIVVVADLPLPTYHPGSGFYGVARSTGGD